MHAAPQCDLVDPLHMILNLEYPVAGIPLTKMDIVINVIKKFKVDKDGCYVNVHHFLNRELRLKSRFSVVYSAFILTGLQDHLPDYGNERVGKLEVISRTLARSLSCTHARTRSLTRTHP